MRSNLPRLVAAARGAGDIAELAPAAATRAEIAAARAAAAAAILILLSSELSSFLKSSALMGVVFSVGNAVFIGGWKGGKVGVGEYFS